MAKNQHRNLTGDALHNPKGFDGASNGTKPVKDGAGALDWITETQLPKALDYVSAQSAPPTEVAGDAYLIDTTGTAYDINTIAWQSGNTIRIAFNGSPDLSAVAADDYFITSGNGNSSNDGTFIITTVNDGSDYIEITNNDRSDATDDEATDAVGTGYYTLAEWDAVSKISHVTFDGSIWSSIIPSEGQSCYDVTLGAIRVFDGTDWSSSLASGGVTGSGTTNYLARWTPSGSVLGNSVVQDDGTQVHVGGTPTSSTMLKVTPVDKYGIYVDSDQNTTLDISAYIADIANTGTGNIEAIYSTSAGSNDASANVSLFHSNGVTAGTQANSYGLYLTAHTAGTAKWGIYQAGANDKNYFAGAMQFDTAAAAVGYVWTATDADGNGDWAASGGGGSSLWSENSGDGIYFNTAGDSVAIGDTATNGISEGGKLYIKGDSALTHALKVDASNDAEAFSVESASTRKTWMYHMEVAGTPGTPRVDINSSAFMKIRGGRLYMYTDTAGSVNGFRAINQSGHMTLDLYSNSGTKIWQMGSNTGYPNFDNTGKDFTFGDTSTIGARVGIKGDGTTSGTSSLKTTDSGGTTTFEVLDNGTVKSTGQIGSSAGATPNTETPSGTTETIDWDNGNYQILDLESASGNVTLTLSNPVAGFAYFIEIRQDSTTPLDVIFPSTVKFAGETAPYTLDVSTGANAVDAVSLAWNGSEYIASFSQNHG